MKNSSFFSKLHKKRLTFFDYFIIFFVLFRYSFVKKKEIKRMVFFSPKWSSASDLQCLQVRQIVRSSKSFSIYVVVVVFCFILGKRKKKEEIEHLIYIGCLEFCSSREEFLFFFRLFTDFLTNLYFLFESSLV